MLHKGNALFTFIFQSRLRSKTHIRILIDKPGSKTIKGPERQISDIETGSFLDVIIHEFKAY